MKKSQKQVSNLTAHIGFWMRMISNNVSYSFARKLEAGGVTVAEWVILREMYSGGGCTSPGAIAELSGLTRGAVSKLITRLLEKGLVHRRESTYDRRFQEIELTKTGKALVPKLALLADQNDDEFFSGLSNSERNQLTGLLKKLAKIHQLKTRPIE